MEVLSGILIGVVTGLATAWLSLWQSRSQRRWEKREQAYEDAVSAIAIMQRSNQEWLNAYYEQRDLSDQRSEHLRSTWAAARAELHRVHGLGELVASGHVDAAITSLVSALDQRHEDYFEHLDCDGAALGAALRTVRQAALAERSRWGVSIWRKS